MPRYVIQRTFPDGLAIPISTDGARETLAAIDNNTEEGVTWLVSYVSVDNKHTYCIYDGPSPDSIHRAALANGLPVDSITEVRVLDPYFYVTPTQ